jgi:hypothetical protein
VNDEWVFSTGDSVCSHLLTLVPRSWIFYTLKMEAIHSSETSVYTISTQHHIPEDTILLNEWGQYGTEISNLFMFETA